MTPAMSRAHAGSVARWSTASFGQTTGSTAGELSVLREHLILCRRSRGHLFALRGAVDRVHGFVVSRFVTTVMVAGLLIGAGCLLA